MVLVCEWSSALLLKCGYSTPRLEDSQLKLRRPVQLNDNQGRMPTGSGEQQPNTNGVSMHGRSHLKTEWGTKENKV